MKIRLQRYLSQCGVASRRKSEEFIAEGRVSVNDQVIKELGTKVCTETDCVMVDGNLVVFDDPFYAVLNKPKGCITAVIDPEGRATVMDYMVGIPTSVVPVGRLDYYSEGVLLFTNDGILANRLLSSRWDLEKTYHVKLQGKIETRHVGIMRRGVRLDDGTVTRPAQVDILASKSRHDWLIITLKEGKSRQIHRMAEALGYTVQKLQRVAFGNITYYGLRIGDARELTREEVHALRKSVGLSSDVVVRGQWAAPREKSEAFRKRQARLLTEQDSVQKKR